MHFELIARAPLAVQIHMATVIPSFFLGLWLIFLSRKGSAPHRAIGWTYAALMTITAVDAIFVRQLRSGQFSWIHIFVPVTLIGLFQAIHRARRGDIKGHRGAMLGVYIGGLVIAGSLTFYPGRLMYQIFVGR